MIASDTYVAIGVFVGGSVLSAAYLLPIIHRAFFRSRVNLSGGEAPLVMRFAMLVPVLICILLFFYNENIMVLVGNAL